MICPNCNKEIDDFSKFCPHCGMTTNGNVKNDNATVTAEPVKRTDSYNTAKTGSVQNGYANQNINTQNSNTQGYTAGYQNQNVNNANRNPVNMNQNPVQYPGNAGNPYPYNQNYNNKPNKNNTPVMMIILMSVIILLLVIIILMFTCNSCKGNNNNPVETVIVYDTTQAETKETSKKESTAAQTETEKPVPTQPATKPTTPPTTPPTVNSTDYYVNSKYDWSVEIPKGYADNLLIKESDDGATTFYVKSINENSTYPDYGRLFTITAETGDDWKNYPHADDLGQSRFEGSDLHYICIYVTDAPFDQSNADEYYRYKDIIPEILKTFKAPH